MITWLSWITRRFNGCLTLALVFLLILHMPNVSAVDDLFSVQGNVYNGTGDPLPLGNLSVSLYENNSCGDYFYNSGSDFNYSIVEGQYDVMLGNETQTALIVDPTLRYLWIGTAIDGAIQSFNSTGGKCRSFSNPFYMGNSTIDQRIEVFNATLVLGTPGGINGSVQFNNNNAFNGSSNLTWENSATKLRIDGNGTYGEILVLQGEHGATNFTGNDIYFNRAAPNYITAKGALSSLYLGAGGTSGAIVMAISAIANSLYLDAGGVGILRTSPRVALDVTGAVNVSKNVTALEYCFFTGNCFSEANITNTYYADEEWINLNGTSSFNFNETTLADGYYNKSEVNDLVSSIAFELYLYNSTDADLPAYNVMNETNSFSADEKSIQITVAADATPLQEFVTNASVNILRAGVYDSHLHLNASTAGKQDARVYWEGYVRYVNGTETLLVTSEESAVLTSTPANYDIHGSLLEDFEVNTSSDKLVAKFYANLDGAGGNPDVWMLIEGLTGSRFVLQTTSDAFSNLYLKLDGSNADRNIDINGYNLTTGDIMPDMNDTRDIGTNTSQYRTLYLTKDIWFDANRYIQWVSPTLTIRGGGIQFQVSDRILGRFDYDVMRVYRNTVLNNFNSTFNLTVRGDTDGNLFEVDGSDDKVGVGTYDLTTKFTVNGTSNFTQNATFEDYITADWLRGQFNWTTNSSFFGWNGSTLSFNEALLNQTIDDRSINESTAVQRDLSATYLSVYGTSVNSLDATAHIVNITRQLPRTFNGVFQPFFIPRTLNYSLINADGIFGVFYEFNVTGIDQDNNDYYEYQSGLLAPAGRASFESDKAFAIVYNYTLNMSSNGGLFPFVNTDLGRGQWIGLPNYPLSVVYKAVADGLFVEETPIYNTTWGLVYLNETWAMSSRTYWYTS